MGKSGRIPLSQIQEDAQRRGAALLRRDLEMFRRLSAFGVAVLVAAQLGCHSRCDSRPGFFTSHTRHSMPCQTVGRNGGCFDAATGQPVVGDEDEGPAPWEE